MRAWVHVLHSGNKTLLSSNAFIDAGFGSLSSGRSPVWKFSQRSNHDIRSIGNCRDVPALDLSVTVTLAIFGQNSRTKRSTRATLPIVEKLEQASRGATDLAGLGCPGRIGPCLAANARHMLKRGLHERTRWGLPSRRQLLEHGRSAFCLHRVLIVGGTRFETAPGAAKLSLKLGSTRTLTTLRVENSLRCSQSTCSTAFIPAISSAVNHRDQARL